jgi:hypothetical protein
VKTGHPAEARQVLEKALEFNPAFHCGARFARQDPLRLCGEPIAGKMGIVRVKLSFVALIAAAAVSGACQSEREREAERSRVERDRGSAAFKAGQAAHKLANGAAKVAEAAGRKLDNAAGKAREGWKEQERKDRERK